jgi:hypothetical protein
LETKINGHPSWPVHSPDLMPCDFFCGKDTEYKNNWHMQHELEEITRIAV